MADNSSPPSSDAAPYGIDITVAQPARIWNYWLGGKDNFAVDREVGDHILEIVPDMVNMARAVRGFLGRAVRYLAGDAGIRQFLDVGTGLPTADNTHEVAQRAAPESRIVYVDNDPLVLTHARALLVNTTPNGVTTYVDSDVAEPEKILRAAAQTLDLSQPTALMLLGIMEFVTDTPQAYAIVNRLMDALPSGSYLVLSHPTNAVHGEASDRVERLWNEVGSTPLLFRSPAEIGRFFDGLEILDPGVVSVSRWRPEAASGVAEVDEFCAVGRKP